MAEETIADILKKRQVELDGGKTKPIDQERAEFVQRLAPPPPSAKPVKDVDIKETNQTPEQVKQIKKTEKDERGTIDKMLTALTFGSRLSAEAERRILRERVPELTDRLPAEPLSLNPTKETGALFSQINDAIVELGMEEVRRQPEWETLPEFHKGMIEGSVKMGTFIGGLTQDIFYDPVTYAGIGGPTKLGKAARLVRDPIKQITMSLAEQAARGEVSILTMGGKRVVPKAINKQVFKAIDKIREGVRNSQFFKQFGRHFVSPTGHPVTDFLNRRARDTKNQISGRFSDEYTFLEREKKNLSGKLGIKNRDLDLLVDDAIETGPTGNGSIDELAQKYKDLGDQILPLEREMGIHTSELTGDVDYWARITTPEAKDALRQKGLNGKSFPAYAKGFGHEWDPSHASQLERSLVKNVDEFGNVEQYTLREANELMKEKYGLKGDFFYTNPSVSETIRADRAARAIRSRQFIDQTLDYFRSVGEAETITGANAAKVRELATLRAGGDETRGLFVEKRDLQKGLEDLLDSADDDVRSGATELKGLLAGNEAKGMELLDITAQADNPNINKAVQELAKNKHKIHVLPEEVATELNRVRNGMGYGTPIGPVLKVFDGVQNWWKAWTLGIFPAYHARNIVGNVHNNALAGVYNPDHYARAMRIQSLGYDAIKRRKLQGNLENFFKTPVQGVAKSLQNQALRLPNVGDEQAVLEAAYRFGVVDQGLFGADIPKELMNEIQGGTWRGTLTFSRRSKPLLAGRAVGSFFENNARMAHFVAKVDEGVAAAKAAGIDITPVMLDQIYENASLSVKKFLFDYQDLTGAERNILKRVFPFYTWTRKNLPLQLENLIKQPGKGAGIEKARQGAFTATDPREDRSPEEWGGLEQKYLSDFIKDNYGARTRILKDGTEEYLTIAGWLPFGDLIRMSDPAKFADEAVGMTSPILKTPYELTTNNNLFFENMIERTAGEKEMFLRIPMRKKVTHILKQLRLLNELDRTFFRTGQGQLDAQGRALRAMTGFRVYPQDPARQLDHYDWEIRKEIAEYEKAIRRMENKIEANQFPVELGEEEIIKLEAKIEELKDEGEKIDEEFVKWDQSNFQEYRDIKEIEEAR
jgi:hypothetical protein